MLQTITVNTEDFFNKALKELSIDSERKQLLEQIASTVATTVSNNKKSNLNFICTHNSRRSQLCQVWASYAISHYNLKKIEAFSGGTAVTSFFRNTVKTLQEVGFSFQLLEFSHQNPEYLITNKCNESSVVGYSKLFDDKINSKPFIAITTCSDANENCPFIPEASYRFHLPFTDPKIFDNTLYQAEKYLETNKKIAGEIHYIFKKITTLI